MLTRDPFLPIAEGTADNVCALCYGWLMGAWSAVGANELSNELWRQRELLELLLYKFEVEQLLLASGKARWVPHATREAEVVIERLRTATLSMSVSASALAIEWNLPADTRRPLSTRPIATSMPCGRCQSRSACRAARSHTMDGSSMGA